MSIQRIPTFKPKEINEKQHFTMSHSAPYTQFHYGRESCPTFAHPSCDAGLVLD